jgi:hypothetical protein
MNEKDRKKMKQESDSMIAIIRDKKVILDTSKNKKKETK